MDSRRLNQDPGAADAALDFVRFCYRRRRAGWPELYDEMCAVASRGLYHGWGFAELAEHGITFGLVEMPRLAGLVAEVNGRDTQRRGRSLVGVMATPAPATELHEDSAEEVGLAPVFMGAAG
jgi:hypothetical protein